MASLYVFSADFFHLISWILIGRRFQWQGPLSHVKDISRSRFGKGAFRIKNCPSFFVWRSV